MPRVTIFALLVVSLAACGGEENTFEREGVSFTYPENWGEAEYEAVDPAAVFGTAFTPEENSLTGLIFEISRGDVTVTEKNIDDVLADAAGALDPSTEGPSRLTVGGLPAIRFVSHPQPVSRGESRSSSTERRSTHSIAPSLQSVPRR